MTIDISLQEKVQQQQWQDIGRPASNLVVKVLHPPAISPGHWGFVLKMRSPTRAGGFVWKYSPLSGWDGNLESRKNPDRLFSSHSAVVEVFPDCFPGVFEIGRLLDPRSEIRHSSFLRWILLSCEFGHAIFPIFVEIRHHILGKHKPKRGGINCKRRD